MARPSKYTPETAARIVMALEAGATLKAAAQAAGVSEDTLSHWRVRYADFADRLARAEALAEVSYVGVLQAAAQGGDWRAAAWWLERRRSGEWREKKATEVTGGDGGPVALTVEQEPFDYDAFADLFGRLTGCVDSGAESAPEGDGVVNLSTR